MISVGWLTLMLLAICLCVCAHSIVIVEPQLNTRYTQAIKDGFDKIGIRNPANSSGLTNNENEVEVRRQIESLNIRLRRMSYRTPNDSNLRLQMALLLDHSASRYARLAREFRQQGRLEDAKTMIDSSEKENNRAVRSMYVLSGKMCEEASIAKLWLARRQIREIKISPEFLSDIQRSVEEVLASEPQNQNAKLLLVDIWLRQLSNAILREVELDSFYYKISLLLQTCPTLPPYYKMVAAESNQTMRPQERNSVAQEIVDGYFASMKSNAEDGDEVIAVVSAMLLLNDYVEAQSILAKQLLQFEPLEQARIRIRIAECCMRLVRMHQLKSIVNVDDTTASSLLRLAFSLEPLNDAILLLLARFASGSASEQELNILEHAAKIDGPFKLIVSELSKYRCDGKNLEECAHSLSIQVSGLESVLVEVVGYLAVHNKEQFQNGWSMFQYLKQSQPQRSADIAIAEATYLMLNDSFAAPELLQESRNSIEMAINRSQQNRRVLTEKINFKKYVVSGREDYR